jgi:hypothetical protein
MRILDIISETSVVGNGVLHAEAGPPPRGTTTPATEKWYEINQKANAKAYENIQARWTGGLYRTLQVLGWLGPCIWFTASYWALDDIAGLSDEEFTKFTGVPASNKNKWVADSRSMLLGTFTAQYLAAGVYYLGKNILRVTGIIQLICGAVGIVVTKGRGGALIFGAQVVEQAALIAFVNWLGTPDGQKWMQQNLLVAGILKVTGAGLGTIWDVVYNKFFEYSGITKPAPSNVDKAVDAVSQLPKGTLGGAEYKQAMDQFKQNFGN